MGLRGSERSRKVEELANNNTIVVKNGKNKIKNEIKRGFFKIIKNGKKREKNGQENNLTLLHLVLHFKIKNLVYTI